MANLLNEKELAKKTNISVEKKWWKNCFPYKEEEEKKKEREEDEYVRREEEKKK